MYLEKTKTNNSDKDKIIWEEEVEVTEVMVFRWANYNNVNYIEKYRFRKIMIYGDGNCLFTSVIYSVLKIMNIQLPNNFNCKI